MVSRYKARRIKNFKFDSLNLKNKRPIWFEKPFVVQVSENKKQSKNYRAVSKLQMITKYEGKKSFLKITNESHQIHRSITCNH